MAELTAAESTSFRTGEDRVIGTAWRQRRYALLVFCGAEIAALAWWVHVSRGRWFHFDDWVFVTQRGLAARELFAPYNGHWTTVPILIYRLLWQVVGLNTYGPYQAVTIGLQLVNAALLRALIRRADIGPWIATVAASLFLFYGAGSQDVFWAFQMTFTGALAFGFAQLLLADHEGAVDWRDLVGLGAGLAAVMCSDVGVAMVVGVGVATLLRRGWRAAALQTIPLGAIFLAWWFIAKSWGLYHLGAGDVHLNQALSFAVTGLGATIGGIGRLPGTAWLIAGILVIGLGVAWVERPADRVRRFAIPVGLAVAALVFVGTTAAARAHEGSDHARTGRYLHVQVAMLAPALALAVDAFLRRWRVFTIVVSALFVVGLPRNLSFAQSEVRNASVDERAPLLALPRMRVARRVPRSLRPMPVFPFAGMTIGWLLDAAESGRLPDAIPMPPAEASQAELRLLLMQLDRRPVGSCRPLVEPITVQLNTHQTFGVRGEVISVTNLGSTNGVAGTVLYQGGHVLLATARPLTLKVAPGPLSARVRLCGLP